MSTSSPPDAAAVALLHSYAAHHGIALAPDASTLQLLIDGRYALRLQALRGEGLMVSAHLRPLPEPGLARDELLLAFARLACGTMKEQATTCSVDARERALWLQLPARAQSLQHIDEAIGTFVNSLAFWSKASSSL
ncbi:CesT family type III secretion system chaperone [Pantoea sp. 18069]|uniref:CesT family type III secretion system chaperone n=1 Tax=Pantoea sp. 18069 TaxID=2681415 RepID=UPI001359A11A|nr:CesT family type III secretion system chaperone [Pantoea sp. 18069]